MRPILLTLLLALPAALFAESDAIKPPATNLRVFELEGGGSITGWLLKESAEMHWVDVGHDVLRLPSARVLRIHTIASDDAADTSAPHPGDIFHVLRETQTLPVDAWVRRLGEGVVEIRSRAGQGSGFLLNAQGHVLTNHHVIAGDRELTVTVFSGKDSDLERIQYRNIRILAMDPANDLALLVIDDELKRPLTWLPLGRAGDMNTGETVFAIGSPLGLDRTVSRGIISLTERIINGALFLQTTTQINPGNSGGPLLNLRGEVVGVNTLKFMRAGIEGVGFAVPAETVKLFLSRRSAYSFDPRNPNVGYHYLNPPRKRDSLPPQP